jgi:hypothetical protein
VVALALGAQWGCGTTDVASVPNTRATDAGPHDIACPTTEVTEDRDGDGVVATWIVGCGTSLLAPDQSAASDCDDTDPARSELAWADSDGDGWISGDPQCVAKMAPGYVTNHVAPRDCDDHDAAVQAYGYDDRDGDGYGSGIHCVPVGLTHAPPSGVAFEPGDCNDRDPLIHPGAFEQWRDGVDSDCDGRDDPLDCDSAADASVQSPVCGCELLDAPRVATNAACQGDELFVAQQLACTDCIGHNLFVIGNRGAAATSGGYDLRLADDPTPLHVNQDLAPGEVSMPIVVEGSGKLLRVVSPGSCEPNAPGVQLLESQSQCLTE